MDITRDDVQFYMEMDNVDADDHQNVLVHCFKALLHIHPVEWMTDMFQAPVANLEHCYQDLLQSVFGMDEIEGSSIRNVLVHLWCSPTWL